MTRFEREINGLLGEYWKKDALKKIENVKTEYDNGEITIDENGVAYNKIGRVVMDDIAEVIEYAGLPINRKATANERNKANEEIFKAYKHEPTTEEIVEMRATFGEGTKVVDLISGKTIVL